MKSLKLTACLLSAALLCAPFSGCTDDELISQLFEPPIEYRAADTVLFAGDSITALCDVDEYYPDYTAVNFGNSGEGVFGFSTRITESYNTPQDVYVLLIGINDLAFFGGSAESTAQSILQIADDIHKNQPQSMIVVQSIYPVNTAKYGFADASLNSLIDQTNALLCESAQEHDFIWCDVNSALKDENGEFRAEWTVDGLHPNPEGYSVASQVVNATLAQIKIPIIEVEE